MATLVAIAYPDEDTALRARTTVWELQEELIIQAEEVAVISRDPDGKYHVRTSHSGFSTAGGAIWGGFWGFLFGALFLIPFAGWAVGAGLKFSATCGRTRSAGPFSNKCGITSSRAPRRCS